MNRKLGEVGKIAGSTAIFAVVIVGIVAYLGYEYYQQQLSKTGSGITWTAVLENGSEIPLNGTTTFYTSPQTLALYSDQNHTTKIVTIKCQLYVTANTIAQTTGNVTLSGTGRMTIKNSAGSNVMDSGNITEPSQTLSQNVKTATWSMTIGNDAWAGWISDTYDIFAGYTIHGSAPIAGGSVTGDNSITSDLKVYWTKDTLTIVPELSWTTFSLS